MRVMMATNRMSIIVVVKRDVLVRNMFYSKLLVLYSWFFRLLRGYLLDPKISFGAELLNSVLAFVENDEVDSQATHCRKLHALFDQVFGPLAFRVSELYQVGNPFWIRRHLV